MDRRTLLMAAGVVPVAALAPLPAVPAAVSEPTEIQSLYVEWLALTVDFRALEAKYALGEIGNEGVDGHDIDEMFEAIFIPRDRIEDQLFSLESQTLEDFAIKTTISAHFEWNVTHMQESLLADTARLLKTAG